MRYTIKHHTEEFQCEQCGFPLYVGGRAFYDDRLDMSFCGEVCADRVRKRIHQPINEDEQDARSREF